MIKDGINAIILSPVDWEKITPSLKKLKDAGVKIINVDTQVKEMSYVDAYVGSDNKNAGYICGEDLIKKSPDGGTVAILECPTQNSMNERITGFEEAISKAEKGFEVVDRADTKGKFNKALKAAEKMLKKYPNLTAIMCGNDQLAVAAKTAVNVVGNDKVLIYGVDGSPDIKKELKKRENQIVGTAAQSPINIGKKAAETADNILDGNDYEKEVYEEVFMINKDNVDMYGTDGWQ
jgi:ABC-type sugar transport system substrate-binding protein